MTKKYRKMKSKIKTQRQERHLMEEVIIVVVVGDENDFLENLRSNAFNQPIMAFCHSIPNLSSTFESFGSGLTVQPCCGIYGVG